MLPWRVGRGDAQARRGVDRRQHPPPDNGDAGVGGLAREPSGHDMGNNLAYGRQRERVRRAADVAEHEPIVELWPHGLRLGREIQLQVDAAGGDQPPQRRGARRLPGALDPGDRGLGRAGPPRQLALRDAGAAAGLGEQE